MEVVFCILAVLFGVLVGVVITRLVYKPKPEESLGVIRVDQSDPTDGPYLFLEFTDERNVGKVINSKRVTFDVLAEDYITRD